MKKISILKYLVLASIFLSTTFGFAQAVVAVPPGCTVVKPGIGGTVGTSVSVPPGKVGQDGIVSMPDPGGGGAFNFTVAGVATTATWSLKGDISNTNITPNSSPVQPVAGSSANIFTCNKNLRASETLAPSLSSWARSKGQVKLFFSQSGCSGQTLTFDIFKSFTASPLTNVPAIVGPSCLKPNTVYTYSVDPIVSDNINDPIGVDSYYWSGIPASYLLPNPDFYTSADGSSITFKTGANFTGITFPLTIRCGYGRVNPTALNVDGGVSTFTTAANGNSTFVTKSLTVAPSQPVFSATTFLSTLATMNTTVNPSACLATGQNTFTLTYPNPASGQIYTWTAPNSGWTFSASTTGTTTLTGNTNGNNGPATITLTITGNSCDPAVFNYQINRNLAAPLVVVPSTPTTTTCISLAGSGNYTISPNASANPVTWSTVPASITGVTLSGATTSTVTVNVASNVTVASFTLQVTVSGSTTPCNTAISTTIYVRPATPTISGPTPACITRGTTTTTAISCNAVTGATGYSWDLTGAPGWSIFANGSTVNPTFTPNGTNAGPVTIKVTALGVSGQSCDGNPSAAFTVNYSPVAPAITAIGCWNTSVPAVGSLVMPAKTLTITNFQTFGTYTVDANAALFSGFSVNTTTGVITLNNPVFLNTGSYSLVVRHANGTCTDATTTLTITVTAVTVTIPVTAVSGFVASGIVDNYLHTSGAGGVTFANWFVNNVPVISGGNVGIISNQLSLAGPTPPTNVGIYVNDNGCFKRVYSPTVGTRGSRMSNPNTSPIKGIIISPNPNDGNFTITALDFKDSATAILFDMNGSVIATAILTKGENKIEKAGLAKGTYIVSLLVDGKTEARKIIIK